MLIIDEVRVPGCIDSHDHRFRFQAYMLYNGGSNKNNDPFRTAVIDTIVAEVQGFPGEDRCVLLLGYKDKMEEMFQVRLLLLSF